MSDKHETTLPDDGYPPSDEGVPDTVNDGGWEEVDTWAWILNRFMQVL